MMKKKLEKLRRDYWDNILALCEKHRVRLPRQLEDVSLKFRDSDEHRELICAFLEKSSMFLEPMDKNRCELSLKDGTRKILRSFDHLQDLMPKVVNFAGNPASSTIACKPGCNYCCTIRVTVLATEALVLAHYLKKKLSTEQMESLLARISEFELETATLTPIQQVLRSTMCPLNVDGFCIGYANRPINCIGYHSFDVQKCIEDSESPESEPLVPQDKQRWSLRGLHFEALYAAMNAFNLDVTQLEFVPALSIALRDDEACTKYLLGEPVFAAADNHEVRNAQANDMLNRGIRFDE